MPQTLLLLRLILRPFLLAAMTPEPARPRSSGALPAAYPNQEAHLVVVKLDPLVVILVIIYRLVRLLERIGPYEPNIMTSFGASTFVGDDSW